MVLGLVGCRGAAYREVYQQKMIRELRMLEDRLNEAEYHNQVLKDELSRKRDQVSIPSSTKGRSPKSPSEAAVRERIETPTPAPSATGNGSVPRPALPARPFGDLPNGRGPSLEPPDVQLPPGRETIEFPDVDLGEPVPPAGRDAIMELPPGQIPLPGPTSQRGDSPAAPAADPVGIRIEPSLSGGYRDEDLPGGTGMQLLVQAIDQKGDPVPMDAFQIAGKLSVVLLDPLREPADARLGRWDYDEQELHRMIRPGPYGGLQLYLDWPDKRPLGDRVLAHVKLGTEAFELRTEAELSTQEAAVAEWNPRGSTTR